MILVDSSAWIALFNGARSPVDGRLAQALRDEEDLATLDLVLLEVLRGFRVDAEFAAARAALWPIPRPTLSSSSYVSAAQLYRRLRLSGVTVNSAVDCIVAQAAMDLGARLLTADRGFHRIANCSALRLEPTAPR